MWNGCFGSSGPRPSDMAVEKLMRFLDMRPLASRQYWKNSENSKSEIKQRGVYNYIVLYTVLQVYAKLEQILVTSYCCLPICSACA